MDVAPFLPLLVIFFFILFSAFFSASETALTAVSKAKIHRMATAGNKRAQLVGKIRENKESLLGAMLLGNNAVNIAASSLATSLAIQHFGSDQGVFYATLLMTLAVLVFGEVLPKTLAFRRSEAVSLLVAPPMSILVWTLAPITAMVQFVVDILMRIIGVGKSSDEKEESYDVEALRGAIDLSHQEGSVVKRDRDMLGGILDLGNTEVGEIMIHRKNMRTINADERPSEIIRQVIDSEHTRIPLWKDDPDNIVGILHIKSLLRAIRSTEGVENLDDMDILSFATAPWFVPETTLLSDQLHAFRRKRIHFALVVDEYGALMGMVTLEDILEEIVGQIDDETDKTVLGIWAQPDGSYKIHGSVTIRDLNRNLDWNLPDESAHTIAGLVMYEAQKVPKEGEIFSFYDYNFKVLKREGNQVSLLRVRRVVPETKAEE